jgi:hypothetical protein
MMLSKGLVTNSLLISTPRTAARWLEFQGIARVVPGLHLVILTPSRELAELIAPVHSGASEDDTID